MNPYRKLRKFLWRCSVMGFQRGPRITRYYMYHRLRRVGNGLPNKSGRVLSISRSEKLVNVIGLNPTEVISADYPEYNILSLDFPNDSFDFVVSDQVFEHIEGDPYQAVSECYRVLRSGGIAVHTTCFINPIHDVKDFWRFSPAALTLLHRDWMEIIDVGGWGNFWVWSVIRDGMRFVPVPHAKWHPLHKIAIKNDPVSPIVTWIVVRK